MVTYAQLESEPWWGREIPTSAMTGAGLMLRGAFGTGADSFGIKGNNRHLNGGHRSQEWIKNSAYVEPPGSTYTVQSGLTAYQQRFIGAFDFTPGAWGTAANRALMIAITNRLDAAYRAGLLDGIVRQFFGTKDGKTVFGRDVPTGRQISADDSHLDHEHVGVNRAVADDNDAMALIARIMIGSEDSMTTEDVIVGTSQLWDQAATRLTPTGRNFGDDVNTVMNGALKARFDAIDAKLNEILEAVKAIPTAPPSVDLVLPSSVTIAPSSVTWTTVEVPTS